MTCAADRVVTDVSRVKVEENGRSAIFVNEEKRTFHRVKVDGGLVKDTLCADYVVSKQDVGSVVIELKGTDIEHAVDQIDATVTIMKSCKAPKAKGRRGIAQLPMAGLIVCSKYPRADTTFQKKQKKFVAKHGSPLHCVSGKGEFFIEKVLSFNGPK
ncbi:MULTISPECIES: hypothetical protein [unclassified Stenotrophomonas]|uniref:hypothetical protein n=1 Tax=unclassified Stenotrophomonas TaxID=196198 RepID=UPI003012CEEB